MILRGAAACMLTFTATSTCSMYVRQQYLQKQLIKFCLAAIDYSSRRSVQNHAFLFLCTLYRSLLNERTKERTRAHHDYNQAGVEGGQRSGAPGVREVVRQLRVRRPREQVFLGSVALGAGSLRHGPGYPLLEGGDSEVVVIGHHQANVFEAGTDRLERVGDEAPGVAAVVLGARQALLLTREEAGAVPVSFRFS